MWCSTRSVLACCSPHCASFRSPVRGSLARGAHFFCLRDIVRHCTGVVQEGSEVTNDTGKKPRRGRGARVTSCELSREDRLGAAGLLDAVSDLASAPASVFLSRAQQRNSRPSDLARRLLPWIVDLVARHGLKVVAVALHEALQPAALGLRLMPRHRTRGGRECGESWSASKVSAVRSLGLAVQCGDGSAAPAAAL